MPRPVQWSRDLYLIRERALRSRTETWSRGDLEHLFGISRASAKSLIRPLGNVRPSERPTSSTGSPCLSSWTR